MQMSVTRVGSSRRQGMATKTRATACGSVSWTKQPMPWTLSDIALQVVSTAVESLAESVEFCLSVRRTRATRCVAVAHTRTDAWPRKIR
jgi:hypothetical protein